MLYYGFYTDNLNDFYKILNEDSYFDIYYGASNSAEFESALSILAMDLNVDITIDTSKYIPYLTIDNNNVPELKYLTYNVTSKIPLIRF